MLDRLPVLRITMPTPYAIGPVNAYLVEGDPLTLIDAGFNMPEGEEALFGTLSDHGIAPEDMGRILVTHAHPDHYGLVHVVQERSHAPVHFPQREIRRVRDRQMFQEVGRLLLEAGMPLELLFKMDQRRQKEPRPELNHDEVIPLNGGEKFDIAIDGGTVQLETLHMPGHTGGHV